MSSKTRFTLTICTVVAVCALIAVTRHAMAQDSTQARPDLAGYRDYSTADAWLIGFGEMFSASWEIDQISNQPIDQTNSVGGVMRYRANEVVTGTDWTVDTGYQAAQVCSFGSSTLEFDPPIYGFLLETSDGIRPPSIDGPVGPMEIMAQDERGLTLFTTRDLVAPPDGSPVWLGVRTNEPIHQISIGHPDPASITCYDRVSYSYQQLLPLSVCGIGAWGSVRWYEAGWGSEVAEVNPVTTCSEYFPRFPGNFAAVVGLMFHAAPVVGPAP